MGKGKWGIDKWVVGSDMLPRKWSVVVCAGWGCIGSDTVLLGSEGVSGILDKSESDSDKADGDLGEDGSDILRVEVQRAREEGRIELSSFVMPS